MKSRASALAVVEAGAKDTQQPRALPRSVTAMAINVAGLGVFLAAMGYLRTYGRGINDLTATLISVAAFACPVIVLEAIFLKTWRRPSTGFDFSQASRAHLWRALAINFAGLAVFLVAIAYFRSQGRGVGDLTATLVSVAAFACPVIVLEGISQAGHAHFWRALAKLAGFYATLGVGLAMYAVFPEYHGGFYDPFYQLLWRVLPVVAGLAVPYFLVLERYNRRPFDGYWQLSLVLRLKFREVDRAVLGQHLLGWLVKAFYTPLMINYCWTGIARLRSFDPHSVVLSFTSFYDFTYDSLYIVDVLIAVAGYLLTVRLFDSHLRSAEPTPLGWLVALGCYQPFWSLLEGQYLNYGGGGTPWGYWFSRMPAENTSTLPLHMVWGSPVSYVAWGSVILALTAIYVWATLSFGIRFSNLTNRGILTNGPYRFTKHPAYVSKNLGWWMVSMPFLSSVSWQEALRHSLMLLVVNLIYFLRARTEERHLSRDPDYVAYATVMERKGLFRWLGRLFPVLRYQQGRLFNV